MSISRPTTAPDGLDKLRRTKRQLAAFDAALAATGGTFRIHDLRVGPPEGTGNLPDGSAAAVSLAVRHLLEHQLETVLAAARDLLVADLEMAKAEARAEYEREFSSIH